MNKKFIFSLFAFSILITVTMFLVSRHLEIGPADVKTTVDSFGIYAPIAYSVLLILGLSVPFNPISDFLVVNIAALLFPPHVSVFFTLISHTISLTINYYFARTFGYKVIKKIVSEDKFSSIQKFSEKLTPKHLFFLRFILPTSNIIGNDILSYLSGIQKMPFGKFFILSIVPWTALSITYFYSTSLIIKNPTVLYLLPLLLIIGTPTAWLVSKKKRSKQKK